MPADEPVRQQPQTFSQEFRLKNFGLQHHAYEDLCRSQWQNDLISLKYCIYRWCLAAFFGTGLCTSMYKYYHSGRYFIYLTHWGFILCSITSLFGATLVTVFYRNPYNYDSYICLLKCYWACYWTNLILANTIGVIFWVTIYPTDPARISHANKIHIYYIFNIWTHAMPSLLYTIDHMVVAHPSRLLHVIYPFGLSMIYLGFTVIYYLCDGTDIHDRPYIYPILNYSKPLRALVTVGMFTGVLGFCSFVQYGIYRLRVYIARKLNKLSEL